jgi:hypothetical protein
MWLRGHDGFDPDRIARHVHHLLDGSLEAGCNCRGRIVLDLCQGIGQHRGETAQDFFPLGKWRACKQRDVRDQDGQDTLQGVNLPLHLAELVALLHSRGWEKRQAPWPR